MIGMHPSGEVRRLLLKSIQGQYTARQQHLGPCSHGTVEGWGNPTWVEEEWLIIQWNLLKYDRRAWRHNSQKPFAQYGRLIVIFRYHTSHQNMAAAFVVTKSRLHEINYRPRRVNEKQINFCMRQNMTKIMKNNEIMKIVMRDPSIWRGRATVI